MIPVHELDNAEKDYKSFDLIQLLPKTGKSNTVPHRHDYYELFLFENGGGSHVIDFREVAISACSSHLVAPGQVHHLKRSDNSVGFALLFKENFLRDNKENMRFIAPFAYMEQEAISPIFQFSKEEFSDILTLISMIDKEVKREEELNFDIISQLLNTIILNCRRKKEMISNSGTSHDQHLYAEYRRLVDRHYKDYKMVKDYAALLNVTERQINDASKKGCGRPASNIIFDRIIIESKRLLVNTSQSVKEICFELNYEDLAHFSKFFKNQCGDSPSQFREKYK